MRHRGSVSQINKDRNKTIIYLYRKALDMLPWPTTQQEICEKIAILPTPQFYISFDTALYYVRCRYYQKQEKQFLNEYKQRLFDAFFNRFLELVENPSYRNYKMKTLINMALDSPAPCLGMSPWMIYDFLRKHRRERKIKKR